MSDKTAYTRKLEAEIEEWNAEIDLLRAKAKSASADAQLDYEQQIEDLKSKRDEMEGKLQELNDASAGAWEDVKRGVDRAWKDMSAAVDAAASRFR